MRLIVADDAVAVARWQSAMWALAADEAARPGSLFYAQDEPFYADYHGGHGVTVVAEAGRQVSRTVRSSLGTRGRAAPTTVAGNCGHKN